MRRNALPEARKEGDRVKPLNTFGELEVHDMETGATNRYPAYTCGHCTTIVVMREDRTRQRNLCFHCMRYICESKPICNEKCTPMYALANDGFQDKSSHSTLVHAIMSGAESSEEAVEKGLI